MAASDPAHLVLDRHRPLWTKLNEIGLPNQAEDIGPEGKRPQLPHSPRRRRFAQIDSLVTKAPPHREDVLVERLLHMDKRTLPRTVAEMLERRDRHDEIRFRDLYFGFHPTRAVNVTPTTPSTIPSAGLATL